jgi:hypothetical protein
VDNRQNGRTHWSVTPHAANLTHAGSVMPKRSQLLRECLLVGFFLMFFQKLMGGLSRLASNRSLGDAR